MLKVGTSMNLSKQITEDMKVAMKNHDKVTLNTVRMIKSALMNEKIKLGHDLTPEEELKVLSSEMKQRKESLDEFTKGGREDLAAETRQEMDVVKKYLPKPLTADELKKVVTDTITEVGAKGKSDFGKVMKAVMPKTQGRADGKQVSKIVGEMLSK